MLLDDQGNRFTDELAPRDVVAREIAARGTVLLDLRAIDRGRFPSLMGSLVRGGLRPRADADPRRAGRALHGGRGRHRPRRPHRGAGPLRRGRVRLRRASTARTGWRRTRCSSASSSAAAPRSPRSASQRFRRACPASPGPPADEPVTPELRSALWRDCGLRPRRRRARAAPAAPHLAHTARRRDARSRARKAAAVALPRRLPDRERGVRARTSSSDRAPSPCSRHGGSDRHRRADRPRRPGRGHRRRRRDDRGDRSGRRHLRRRAPREGSRASCAACVAAETTFRALDPDLRFEALVERRRRRRRRPPWSPGSRARSAPS